MAKPSAGAETEIIKGSGASQAIILGHVQSCVADDLGSAYGQPDLAGDKLFALQFVRPDLCKSLTDSIELLESLCEGLVCCAQVGGIGASRMIKSLCGFCQTTDGTEV